MKGITRRFMRKMRGLTRRVKAPFRSYSFRKFMRGIGQRGGQLSVNPVSATSSVSTKSSMYLIKVPAATTNFNFSKAVSTLPESFGTLVPGGVDTNTFTINLNSKYTADNLPGFLVTGYVYSNTAGYIHVQRQFGTQTGVSAAGIAIDTPVKKITFTNLTKVNFPSTANDSKGFALYIAFQILN